MHMISAESLTPAAVSEADKAAERQALAKAGQAFEAMLLEKLLASARPQTSGPEGDWRSIADAQVARSLAENSPLGIARLLEKTV